MTSFELAAILLSLAAGLGYLNARVLRLPSTIGLMAMALFGSLVIVGLDAAGIIDSTRLEQIVAQADFGHTLLHGMLGFLLFAGALHIDLTDLSTHRWSIGLLALGGTVLSTAIVGLATYGMMILLGHDLGLANSLVFGALISPTDPIAVLGILKSAKAPSELAIQIGGESLFNDGIGVVVFLVVLGVASGGDMSAGDVAALFAREALGGAVFGLALGYVGFRLLRSINAYSVEVLITLALVIGGYAAAERLHVSAPIAVVVAGVVVGNQGRRLAMSDETRHHVDLFWELIDEILNAVLFLMLGLEATRLKVTSGLAVAASLAIPLVLLARLVSVAIPISLLRLRSTLSPHAIKIMTWGGLRGGISVALALSLPEGPTRDTILVLTYAVVACSILVQGLTLAPLVRRLGLGSE
ncbi:MAG: sodium:proton antiporter [Myxococcales bacterium]|nr:sodium:proton antiporter [Myxococcales bacterium]